MKKSILVLIAFAAFMTTEAQVVEKGDIILNLGTGFGVETTKTNIEGDSTEAAVPGLLNFTGEYMIGNQLGVAFRAERNGYVTDDEDSTNVVSGNFLIGPTYHVLNNEKHSMYFGILLGSSSIKWTSEIPEDEENDLYVKGTGFTAQFNLGGMMYFSDNVGMFYEAGYSVRNYNELTVHNTANDPVEEVWVDTNNNFDDSDDENVTVDLNGVNVRVGLTIKF